MAEENNPYSSPSAQAAAIENTDSIGISAAALAYFGKASPWIKFIAILGFIGAGALFLMGIVFFISGGAFLKNMMGGAEAGAIFGIGGLIYSGLGALNFFPALFLFKFGVNLRNYCLTHNAQDLESAFRYNYSYWKFNGVLIVIFMALAVLAVPIMVVLSLSGLLI